MLRYVGTTTNECVRQLRTSCLRWSAKEVRSRGGRVGGDGDRVAGGGGGGGLGGGVLVGVEVEAVM